jgi:hypothetical protein
MELKKPNRHPLGLSLRPDRELLLGPIGLVAQCVRCNFFLSYRILRCQDDLLGCSITWTSCHVPAIFLTSTSPFVSRLIRARIAGSSRAAFPYFLFISANTLPDETDPAGVRGTRLIGGNFDRTVINCRDIPIFLFTCQFKYV